MMSRLLLLTINQSIPRERNNPGIMAGRRIKFNKCLDGISKKMETQNAFLVPVFRVGPPKTETH
jgi:hypothetical protein